MIKNYLKLFVLIITVCISTEACCQKVLPCNSLQIIGGYARHGSGDLNGVVFGTEYLKYYTTKFSLNYNFRSSINYGKTVLIVNNAIDNRRTDASVRFTTAGIQIGVNAGLSLLRNSRNEIMTSLGVFGRFQSASNGSDGYQIYSPQSTDQPTILIGYDNKTPQQTLSVGAIFQVQYSYTFNNKIFVGLVGGYQVDTNGDTVPQLAIAIGKRF
jgi:hypothetical protein